MGYMTWFVYQGISATRLRAKIEANIALYEKGTAGRKIGVNVVTGEGCAAIEMGYLQHEDIVLQPIGYQLGCVWMGVRYQDGDWWDISAYQGIESQVNHSVNPWAHEVRFTGTEEAVAYRIKRIGELWPSKAKAIAPYLLLWRKPVRRLGSVRWVPRKGKARASDEHEYGDAMQVFDFLRILGIDDKSPRMRVEAAGNA